MDAICCFVPDIVLNEIIDRGEASGHVIDSCHSTIATTEQARAVRLEHCAETLRTFAAHLESVATAGTAKLNRTVFDAQESELLSRNKILIREGGALISERADPTKDPNECYVGFEKTYNFYLEFFNRNSVDDKGMKLDGFVHYGLHFQNAFWDGKEMVFGDGDGEIFNGFTDELDVIAHELTHGVVEYTCPLEYEFQSGALNESIADVFGIMVKQWAEDPAQPQTAEESNWLIGEGIWGKGIQGKALRSMKQPGSAYNDPRVGHDRQPAHWKDFAVLPNTRGGDYGGVHINSGIPNHAFYLAAAKIGGYAWKGAGQIWYAAMTSGTFGPNATFKEFADATIASAGEHASKVQEAWNEVGYPFPEA